MISPSNSGSGIAKIEKILSLKLLVLRVGSHRFDPS